MDQHLSEDRIEYVAQAVVALLSVGGLDGLSMRTIAKKVVCDPSTLAHRFGSRQAMLTHVAGYLGRDWLQRVGAQWPPRPGAALVTDGREFREHLRAWLAMCELGRGDERLGHVVAEIELAERHRLERLLPDHCDRPTRDAYVAVVRGLHHALGAGVDPMRPEQAQAALDRFEELLALSAPDATTPPTA